MYTAMIRTRQIDCRRVGCAMRIYRVPFDIRTHNAYRPSRWREMAITKVRINVYFNTSKYECNILIEAIRIQKEKKTFSLPIDYNE